MTARSFEPDYQTPARMAAKLAAMPLPDLGGKHVLDVGCDMGAWCWLAAERGAKSVLGLDRGRVVKDRGFVDLVAENVAAAAERGLTACHFLNFEAGKQYHLFGHFDVVLCLSVYHHIYEAAGGDHNAIWFWLWWHARLKSAVLLWEGPVGDDDPVVRANVSGPYRHGYTRAAILAAASRYFEAEFIGPAMHEPTREVWRFTPARPDVKRIAGEATEGAGGASHAFTHAGGRRVDEVENILGWRPIPGSLNVRLDGPFWWDRNYFRARVLDVVDRSQGFDGEWAPRWARFYPVSIDGEDAVVFRFERERYPEQFVELIAPWRLRDTVARPKTEIASC